MTWNPLHIYSEFKKQSQEKKNQASWKLLKADLESLASSLKRLMFTWSNDLCWTVCVEPSTQISFGFITQENFCFYTAMSDGTCGLGLKWSALPLDVASYLANKSPRYPVKKVELHGEVYLTLLEFDQKLIYTAVDYFSILSWLKTILESLLVKAQQQQRAKLNEVADEARQKSSELKQISQKIGDTLTQMKIQEEQHV